jgi:hypothetical protein
MDVLSGGALMLLPVHHLRRIVSQGWRRRLRVIVPWLPRHWLYRSSDRRVQWYTGADPELKHRACLVKYDLQDGCFLEAYWIDRTSSQGTRDLGPAVFLVVHGSEILKFDCYGPPVGHYHVATPYPYGIGKGLAGRIWLPERSVDEQIDRAMFELCRNANYYLRTHPRRKVRSTVLDEGRLAAVCVEIRAKMLDDVARLLPISVRQPTGRSGGPSSVRRLSRTARG